MRKMREAREKREKRGCRRSTPASQEATVITLSTTEAASSTLIPNPIMAMEEKKKIRRAACERKVGEIESFLCNCVLAACLNKMKVHRVRSEGKGQEVGRKKLRSQSSRFVSSSNPLPPSLTSCPTSSAMRLTNAKIYVFTLNVKIYVFYTLAMYLTNDSKSVCQNHVQLELLDVCVHSMGEDGELRLGIRRATQMKNGTSFPSLCSQQLNRSTFADVVHAISMKSVFSIYYNPRANSSEFIIPVHKFSKSLDHSFSVGMRFEMRFETEDATERRYTRLVTGISDMDSVKWPDSIWRCLLL
ncbi:hypothetical protein REPUB_Repub08aG0117700 [Reevesia pubescens]